MACYDLRVLLRHPLWYCKACWEWRTSRMADVAQCVDPCWQLDNECYRFGCWQCLPPKLKWFHSIFFFNPFKYCKQNGVHRGNPNWNLVWPSKYQGRELRSLLDSGGFLSCVGRTMNIYGAIVLLSCYFPNISSVSFSHPLFSQFGSVSYQPMPPREPHYLTAHNNIA